MIATTIAVISAFGLLVLAGSTCDPVGPNFTHRASGTVELLLLLGAGAALVAGVYFGVANIVDKLLVLLI